MNFLDSIQPHKLWSLYSLSVYALSISNFNITTVTKGYQFINNFLPKIPKIQHVINQFLHSILKKQIPSAFIDE